MQLLQINLTTGELIGLGFTAVATIGGVLSWWFAKFIQDSRSDTIHQVKIENLEKKVVEIETKMDKNYYELNEMASKNFEKVNNNIVRIQTDVVKQMGDIKVLIEQKIK